jgi:hypothetical protein
MEISAGLGLKNKDKTSLQVLLCRKNLPTFHYDNIRVTDN